MGKSHFPQRFYGGQDWGQCPGCKAGLYWFSLRIVTSDKPASLHHLDECMLCNVEMPEQSIERVSLREGGPGLPASWLLVTAAADCCLWVEHRFGPFLQVPAGRPFTSTDFEIENSLKRVWEKLHRGHPYRHICDSLDLLAPTLLADAARRAELAGRPPLAWPDDAAAYPSFPAACDWDAESSEEPDGSESEPEASNSPNSVGPLVIASQDGPALADVNDVGDVWADEEINETSEDTPESHAKWSAAVAKELVSWVVAWPLGEDGSLVEDCLALGMNALMFASAAKQPAVVSWLVSEFAGKAPDSGWARAVDKEGRTALMHAALAGDTECVKVLLPWSQPDQQCASGMTALMHAAQSGREAAVRALIPFSNVAAKGKDEQNAICCAASSGDVGTLRALIERPGIRLDDFQVRGRTPLMFAAEAESVEPIELLLPLSDPRAQCDDGMTALMYASKSGCEAAVRALAPVSDVATIGRGGKSAVACAVISGSVETLRALLEVPGVHPDDFRFPPNGDNTPLVFAVQADLADLIELLLPRSNPNAQLNGKTTLLYAAEFGELATLRALLPASVASIAAADVDTALIHAASRGRDFVEALLPHSDPKRSNTEGFTALMHAAFVGDLDSLALLLPTSDALARSRPARKKARDEARRFEIHNYGAVTALSLAALRLSHMAHARRRNLDDHKETVRVIAECMKPGDIAAEFALLVRANEYVAAEALGEFITDQAIGEALASALARGKKHARMASLMPRAFVRYEQSALRHAVVRGEVGAPSESTLPDSALPRPIRAAAPTPAVRARRL
jgi:ankyrin repeat protein